MTPVLVETFCVGLGTYLIRAGSLFLGSRVVWPSWMVQWLSFVTPAVLGALLGPLLFLPTGHWIAPLQNATLLAAIPTAAVAWFTRNLLWTLAAGIASFALLSYWF